jgi:hypothetical protein
MRLGYCSPNRRHFELRAFDWRRLASGLALLLAGCTVGPKYETPATPTTDIFKEATPADYKKAGIWRPARPSDTAGRGKWWQIYGDPELDRLEDGPPSFRPSRPALPPPQCWIRPIPVFLSC